MSNEKKLHPEPGLLLQYADGELKEAERMRVHDHLAECSECRESLNELGSGIADYKHSWIQDWKSAAEAPPKPWFDLRKRMDELDRPAASIPARWRSFRLQWAAAAAAILIGVAGLYWISERPVSAAQLLRDAALRETSAERTRLPIRLTTRSGSIVRPALWQPQQSTRATPAAQSLRTRFEEAHYSWEDPLSARSFSAWREKLRDAQDDVVQRRENDGTRSYEIKTRTASGSLAEASLRFRASDLRAIEGTLRFRDNEVVGITEAPNASLDLPLTPDPPASIPSADTKTGDDTVTAGDELRVRAALRRIDADLGEPVEVERDNRANAIVVTALGLKPERRRVLQGALSGR